MDKQYQELVNSFKSLSTSNSEDEINNFLDLFEKYFQKINPYQVSEDKYNFKYLTKYLSYKYKYTNGRTKDSKVDSIDDIALKNFLIATLLTKDKLYLKEFKEEINSNDQSQASYYKENLQPYEKKIKEAYRDIIKTVVKQDVYKDPGAKSRIIQAVKEYGYLFKVLKKSDKDIDTNFKSFLSFLIKYWKITLPISGIILLIAIFFFSATQSVEINYKGQQVINSCELVDSVYLSDKIEIIENKFTGQKKAGDFSRLKFANCDSTIYNNNQEVKANYRYNLLFNKSFSLRVNQISLKLETPKYNYDSNNASFTWSISDEQKGLLNEKVQAQFRVNNIELQPLALKSSYSLPNLNLGSNLVEFRLRSSVASITSSEYTTKFEVIKLDQLKNVKLEGDTLRWDTVFNAAKYQVSLNGGSLIEVSTNSIELDNIYLNSQKLDFSILALGNSPNFVKSTYNNSFNRMPEVKLIEINQNEVLLESFIGTSFEVVSNNLLDKSINNKFLLQSNIIDLDKFELGKIEIKIRAYSSFSLPSAYVTLNLLNGFTFIRSDDILSWNDISEAVSYDVLKVGNPNPLVTNLRNNQYNIQDIKNQDIQLQVRINFTNQSYLSYQLPLANNVQITNIKLNNNLLTWDKITGVNQYQLVIDNNDPIPTFTNEFNISVLQDGLRKIKIQPILTSNAKPLPTEKWILKNSQINLINNELSWTKVDSASYLIYVNNNLYSQPLTNNSISVNSLNQLIVQGLNSIKVEYVTSGNILLNSTTADIQFSKLLKPSNIFKVSQNIVWDEIPGANYLIYLNGSSIPITKISASVSLNELAVNQGLIEIVAFANGFISSDKASFNLLPDISLIKEGNTLSWPLINNISRIIIRNEIFSGEIVSNQLKTVNSLDLTLFNLPPGTNAYSVEFKLLDNSSRFSENINLSVLAKVENILVNNEVLSWSDIQTNVQYYVEYNGVTTIPSENKFISLSELPLGSYQFKIYAVDLNGIKVRSIANFDYGFGMLTAPNVSIAAEGLQVDNIRINLTIVDGANQYIIEITELNNNQQLARPIRTEVLNGTQTFNFIANSNTKTIKVRARAANTSNPNIGSEYSNFVEYVIQD
jgi:hypothetical protein